jgi:hypothetical protein
MGNSSFPNHNFKWKRLCRVSVGIDGVEDWVSNKDTLVSPVRHLPEAGELSFANQLLSLHLESSLADLSSICQEKNQEENSGSLLGISLLAC